MNEKIDLLVESIYSNGYVMHEGFFNTDEVASLLNVFSEKQDLLKEAGIGKDQQHIKAKEIRSDKIVWIEEKEHSVTDSIFFSFAAELIQQLNRRCFLGLNGYEFHFAKYEPGAFYKRHKDAFSNDDARKISFILYLNQNWKPADGGELNIYLEDKTITVLPKAGTIVAFESFMEHEVMPSYANRISLTGWLKSSRNVI